MRRITAFVILLCIVRLLQGQELRPAAWSGAVSLALEYPQEKKIRILAGRSFGQHQVFAGLNLPVMAGNLSLYGPEACYRFFPNSQPAQFDLFFHYRLMLNRRKLHIYSGEKGFELHQTVGYGFLVLLTRDIFLQHSIGAGVVRSWFEGNAFTDLGLFGEIGVAFRFNAKSKQP